MNTAMDSDQTGVHSRQSRKRWKDRDVRRTEIEFDSGKGVRDEKH